MSGVKSAAFAALACALTLAGCSSNPCSMRHVVQVTEDHSPKAEQMKAKLPAAELVGSREDVEIDDGHVYAANFVNGIDATQVDMPPSTGDAVKLCVLTSSNGTKHYSLDFKGSHYVAELVR